MPDNDCVPRSVSGVWRRAARAGLSGLPSAEVGDELRLALAKAVRDAEPPQADSLGRALGESAVFMNLAGWSEAVDDYLDRAGRTDLAFALARQGEAMLEVRRDELCALSDAQVTQELVSSGLRRWIDARVWGPEEMLGALVAGPFTSAQEARQYQQSCLDHAQIEEIAAQLVARQGRSVRAPRTGAPRPTTAEMLNEEID